MLCEIRQFSYKSHFSLQNLLQNSEYCDMIFSVLLGSSLKRESLVVHNTDYVVNLRRSKTKKVISIVLIIVALVSCLALSGCGGDDD